MTDSETMMSLFEGSDVAYGSTKLTGNVTTQGKHEAQCFVVRKPITLAIWELHLMGRDGLGVFPINSRNMVHFGAIDVDVYKDFDIAKLNKKIHENNVPMVLCRSKSGGPHLFMFFKEWVPAKLAVEKLDAIAGFMGFGNSEIFPKQTSISGNDVGNYINMPYFGGSRFMRYGLDKTGTALPDVHAFANFAQSVALDRAGLEAYHPPSEGGPLPDGPPCLNRIFAARSSDMRNVVLSNTAVYCKKAYGEGWEAKLDEYNLLFPEPLGSKEVEAIKKSYGKKEYRYQCSAQPLCSFCSSSACRKAKHGIGGEELLPAQRSLTKIDTAPPVWYLDINVKDKNGEDTQKRMSLTTEELQNPRLFQRRCMDTIQQMPPLVKMEEWQKKVDSLMRHCTIVAVPPELGPQGQFKDLVIEYLLNRASAESFDDLLRGQPHKNSAGYHFRPKDLWKHVVNERFAQLRQHEMLAVLTKDLKAQRTFRKIKGTGVNYLTISHESLTPTSEEPLPLDPAKVESPY